MHVLAGIVGALLFMGACPGSLMVAGFGFLMGYREALWISLGGLFLTAASLALIWFSVS